MSVSWRRSALATMLTVVAQLACAQSELRPAEVVLLGREYQGSKVATPRDRDGRPLLTGYWKLLHEANKPDGNLAKDLPGFALPYSERGKQALRDNLTKYIDPEARCVITGIPLLLTSVLRFEILHTSNRLGTFHMLSWHRWAWLDGRKPEDDPDPAYLGNAIGHWEGDTLVIESSGFRDSADGRCWLDDNGNPQSSQARVIERWSRPDYHHLHLEMTVTDLKYYTRAFTFSRTWVRADEGLGQKEYACNESNLSGELIGPGAGVIGPDGNRGFGYDDPLPAVPPGPEAYEKKE